MAAFSRKSNFTTVVRFISIYYLVLVLVFSIINWFVHLEPKQN